jgi:predicted phosphodiesterase
MHGPFDSLACLADVHCNTAALDAVLAAPEFQTADAVVFMGCLTTGPDPLGVLERCLSLDKPALFIAGNGERAVLEVAQGRVIPEWAAGEWLVERHGTEGLDTIRGWPETIVCEVRGVGAIRVCHGSPRSDIELLTPGTSEERIAEATSMVPERTIAHGHTHLQYQRAAAGRQIIAPGSVGLPYTTGPFGARWAMLGPDVRLLTTGYELAEAERRIEPIGYPNATYLPTLRNPPTPDEIIADAEARLFSD